MVNTSPNYQHQPFHEDTFTFCCDCFPLVWSGVILFINVSFFSPFLYPCTWNYFPTYLWLLSHDILQLPPGKRIEDYFVHTKKTAPAEFCGLSRKQRHCCWALNILEKNVCFLTTTSKCPLTTIKSKSKWQIWPFNCLNDIVFLLLLQDFEQSSAVGDGEFI